MDRYKIERRGGFAGLKAEGTIEADSLGEEDRSTMESLFKMKGALPAAPGADRFVYKVTRENDTGTKTMEIPETLLPRAVTRAVKDSL